MSDSPYRWIQQAADAVPPTKFPLSAADFLVDLAADPEIVSVTPRNSER